MVSWARYSGPNSNSDESSGLPVTSVTHSEPGTLFRNMLAYPLPIEKSEFSGGGALCFVSVGFNGCLFLVGDQKRERSPAVSGHGIS